MSKLSTSLLYLIFYPTLTGFSFGGFVDDLRFKGTSVGVTKCVERNKQEGISINVIRGKCIEEHQKILKPNPTNDIRGKYMILSGTPVIEIIYTNNSSDKVITYFEVKVSHVENKDLNGNQITEIIQFNGRLIPPNSNSVAYGFPIFGGDLFPIGGDLKSVDSSDYSFSLGDTYKGVDFILN